MLRLLKYIIPLLLLIILYDCKREEDPTFFVTASVSNSSEGTVTFNSGDYAVGASVTFTANPKEGYTLPTGLILKQIKHIQTILLQ